MHLPLLGFEFQRALHVAEGVAWVRAGERLRSLLQQHPGALGFAVDMAGSAIALVIRQMQTSEAYRAITHQKM
ncbi:MAG: hypothetical protein O7D97_03620 [Planctomycetota bacterium]|nr:hypothetical protein [Planctomycetota bacterium]